MKERKNQLLAYPRRPNKESSFSGSAVQCVVTLVVRGLHLLQHTKCEAVWQFCRIADLHLLQKEEQHGSTASKEEEEEGTELIFS